MFLYDIRENRELRDTEWIERRDFDKAARQRPPVRVDCSYLVTAWPSDAVPNPSQDEHHILGEVMKVLLRVLSTSGDALDPETRLRMEATFGFDFSGVRLHTDSRAAESVKAV